jgi:hypothetical protein
MKIGSALLGLVLLGSPIRAQSFEGGFEGSFKGSSPADS